MTFTQISQLAEVQTDLKLMMLEKNIKNYCRRVGEKPRQFGKISLNTLIIALILTTRTHTSSHTNRLELNT